MSEGPELPETEALAAEHALGVLSGAERATAELRMARDPAFAAEVEAWRARLAPMLDALADVTPPAHVWARIARALPANDNAGGLRFWRMATMGALGLAAASLAVTVFVANRPTVVVQAPANQPAPLLNASLTSQATGQPLFVAAYMRLEGRERWTIVVPYMLCITIFIYFLFDQLLAIPWPPTYLGDFFPALKAIPSV